MDTIAKVRFSVFGILVLAIVALILMLSWVNRRNEQQVIQLQNDLAEKDKTIEVQKGLYTKLTIQTQNVQGTLDKKDSQVKELTDQLNKQKQELLDASQLVLTWKKNYEGLSSATQTSIPETKTGSAEEVCSEREKVDFHNDFGYIKVDGWTLTNPPQAWVRLTQGRPLKLTLALSQDDKKAWHTYVTSSEDNISAEIRVASVNPYIFQPHWYEKIGIAVDLGAGTNVNGVGALIGVGLNYQFKQFTLGPHVWLGINNVIDKYYGISFEWRPFQKN